MYAREHAAKRPQQPAFIMAQSGEAVTYAELEARSNRLAHLLRDRGLRRLDHYAIFMENNARYIESCCAGECTGLYFTCVNSFLTPEELAYILNNSQSRVLITSQAKRDVAAAALKDCPKIELCLIADGKGDGERVQNLDQATAAYPATPIADESLGTAMLYSSGTTGRPKGILRPLAGAAAVAATAAVRLPAEALAVSRRHDLSVARAALSLGAAGGRPPDHPPGRHRDHHGTLRCRAVSATDRDLQGDAQPAGADDVLAHAQAAGGCAAALRSVLARDRDPRRGALPGAGQGADDRMVGADHHEYYGATEGLGFTACDSAEWLAHKGTVGKVLLGELHVLDENMKPCPAGTPGTLWFKTATPFEYFNDAAEDGARPLGRRRHEHGRRHRLSRQRRLSLSHRPRELHDHLRRRQYLSAGMREPA